MNRFRQQFAGKMFFPVIHVEDLEQAKRNVRYVRSSGADGVFLINHNMSARRLLDIYKTIRSQNPHWFIGLNLLDLTTSDALRFVPADASALWVDDGGLSGSEFLAQRYAKERSQRTDWPGLYFSSVAFKYQPSDWTPAQAASMAAPHADVLVTSGTATGSAPDVDKITAMREAAGPSAPLAIASGITAQNVHAFLPLVDCFMVATGISTSHTELDPPLVGRLADVIHYYQ